MRGFIVKQVFSVVVCWIDHFDGSSLDFQRGLDKPETKAGEPILMFNHEPRNERISEQRQQLRTAIIYPRPSLFDQLDDLIATHGAILREPFCLSLQVLWVRSLRHPCIDCHPLLRARRRSESLNHDGS